MKKPRLFVDMDGTLAEFRKLHIDVEEFEGVEVAKELINKILRTPGYFYSLNPLENVVAAINLIAKEGKIEVFIETCYLTDCDAMNEKNAWSDNYTPAVDRAHRIFVPDGKNKSDYIPDFDGENDYLLDDYTNNLVDWTNQGGIGIKLLNGINGNNGTWNGRAIRFDKSPEEIAQNIQDIILNKQYICDVRPQDEMQEEYDR